jgi:uncharacterized protein YndB with AHSA1/START domain
MPDIYQDFPIQVAPEHVFHAISSAEGLDEWWTKRSSGTPTLGTEYTLYFGEGYDWSARVTECVPNEAFELQMGTSDTDWAGSRVAFRLAARNEGQATWVQFSHTGWPGANEHFRISAHCWALYLRVLRRYLEHGERVPYDDRLNV